MRTTIKLDGKRISKKKAIELLGKETVDKYIKEAKKDFMEDPYQLNAWWVGYGMLEIQFN